MGIYIYFFKQQQLENFRFQRKTFKNFILNNLKKME